MADKDRFTSEWGEMVFDLNIPEGKVHTMKDQDEYAEGDVEKGIPTMTELSGGIEKDQYAEIAERGARFSGEHNTPMSSGNIQKQDAQIVSRAGEDGEPLIQTAGGANPYTGKDMDEKDGEDMVEKVSPEEGEAQATFMDRCIHNLISEGKTPEKSADQCYAIWHSSKGTSQKSQDGEAVKKSALVSLVFKGAIAVGGLFVRKSR